MRQGGETPLFDGLGSRRTGTDSTGAVTGGQTADAFGCPVTNDGAGGGAYGFGATSGYRTEGDGAMFIDAGLVKVGCRYYDPQVGRFITRDTDLSESPYAYCDGDPVNAVDPDGHAPKGNKPKPKPVPKPVAPNYPWQWPTRVDFEVSLNLGVDIKVFTSGGDSKDHLEFDGPDYWKHMPAADRSTVHSYKDFKFYIVKHLFTSAF